MTDATPPRDERRLPLRCDEVLAVIAGAAVDVDLSTLSFAVITGPQQDTWPFALGEVLVLDDRTGREPFGAARKPDKWDVVCRDGITTLAAAQALRANVLKATATQGQQHD